jgi:predicted esterase
MESTDVGAVRTVEARTHGRYLVRQPGIPGPWPMIVGFHGYGEDAEIHMQALTGIPGADRWLVVSTQALHPFYTRRNEVVASWMTRQDRAHAIADNVDYVGRVLAAVRSEFSTRRPLVFVGFSQGGAMAYRAAAHYPADGVIVLAADVPADVAGGPRARLPCVLIGRGTRDDWYTEAKHAADLALLRPLDVAVENCVFEGGHEWTDAFHAAAGRMLAELTHQDP